MRWVLGFALVCIVFTPAVRCQAAPSTASAVLATESGEVLVFDGLYGQDRKLERLLALPPMPVETTP